MIRDHALRLGCFFLNKVIVNRYWILRDVSRDGVKSSTKQNQFCASRLRFRRVRKISFYQNIAANHESGKMRTSYSSISVLFDIITNVRHANPTSTRFSQKSKNFDPKNGSTTISIPSISGWTCKGYAIHDNGVCRHSLEHVAFVFSSYYTYDFFEFPLSEHTIK